MSNLQIKGLFIAQKKIAYGSEGNSFTKFWLEIDKEERYPSQAEFQTFKTDILNGIEKGQELTVHFKISGKKWEKDGKNGFGQNLIAWKIETSASSTASPHTEPEQTDDLPF